MSPTGCGLEPATGQPPAAERAWALFRESVAFLDCTVWSDGRRGDISIQWLEQHMDEIVHAPPPAAKVRIAAIAAALMAQRDRGQRAGAATSGPAAVAGTAPTAPETGADAWRRAARLEGLR